MVVSFIRNLINNNKGVAIGLMAMIILDIVFAMLWIATMPAVGMVWDIINPYLPAEANGPMDMLNNACGWVLLIFVIGTLIYGAAWATRRDPVDVAT